MKIGKHVDFNTYNYFNVKRKIVGLNVLWLWIYKNHLNHPEWHCLYELYTSLQVVQSYLWKYFTISKVRDLFSIHSVFFSIILRSFSLAHTHKHSGTTRRILRFWQTQLQDTPYIIFVLVPNIAKTGVWTSFIAFRQSLNYFRHTIRTWYIYRTYIYIYFFFFF